MTTVDNEHLEHLEYVKKLKNIAQTPLWELNSKQKILDIIHKHNCTRNEYKKLPDNYKNDEDIVISAISTNNVIIQIIDKSIFKKEKVVERILNNGVQPAQKRIFFYKSMNTINKSEKLLINALEDHGHDYLPYSTASNFMENRDFILKLIDNDKCRNVELFLWMLKNCIYKTSLASKLHPVNDDEEIVTKILCVYPFLLCYLSVRLKSMEKFIVMAIERDGSIIVDVSHKMLKNLNKTVLLKAIKSINNDEILDIILHRFPKHNNIFIDICAKDKEIMLWLIDKDPQLYCLLADNIVNKKDRFRHYQFLSGFDLQFRDNLLYEDKDIINMVLRPRDLEEIYFISHEILPKKFYADYDIVLNHSPEHSILYSNSTKELKSNKKLLFEIIKKNGYLLKFASSQLKENKQLALIAIDTYPHAFEYLDKILKHDTDIIDEAMKKDPSIYNILPVDMKKKTKYKIMNDIIKKKHTTLAIDTDITVIKLDAVNQEQVSKVFNENIYSEDDFQNASFVCNPEDYSDTSSNARMYYNFNTDTDSDSNDDSNYDSGSDSDSNYDSDTSSDV
jgi:hypothetical protein